MDDLFGLDEEGVWQPLIMGAIVDDEIIDDSIEVVVSLGGLWFCAIPPRRITDEGIWIHEFVEASVRNLLDTLDMELVFNHNAGYQSVPISHIMSALTTSAGVNNVMKEPDEYWNVIKAGLPFRVPEGFVMERNQEGC